MKKYNAVYKRLFIIYTAILVTCVLSLDAYFIYYSKENIKSQKLYLNKKMIEDIELELIKNTNSVDRIVNGIYDQSFIATDLVNLLNNDSTTYLKMKLDYLAKSNLEFYNGIQRYVNQAFNTYRQIVSIKFLSYARQELIELDTDGTISKEVLDRNTVESMQNQKVISENGKISYIKEISNPVDLKKEGLILITYDSQVIDEIVQSYGDDAIIIDQYGKVIFDSDDDYDRETLMRYIGKLSIGDKISLDGNIYYTNVIVDKLGNIILGRINSYEATKLPLTYYLMLIFIDILVVVVAIFIIHIKLKNLSERMNKIITTMDQVKAGNLDVRIDITDDKDELNYIATQFNDMCIDLKNHIEISYLAEMNKKEAELSKKKAEMLSLQSKINPHFLYNTLESIRMKAIANGNRDVGRMLFLLGNLFRNQLKEDDVITIEKEINYCKEYLELFKFRYDDKFNYYINCEQELLNKEIIKFVLQPLAENYTVHGIRREDYDNELHIDISKNNDNIKIVIEDNGIGIDKNKINEINQKIKEKDFSGKSIGIANTHERIMLLYGEEYGVKVDEEFENGTRIILNIPMRGE
ncbi:histidine kinase [Clostridium saudiense]|jgi:two-component system sensor histidine kinase YesM|uniref:Histidine kinase n=1 Tax=Clostridium saudiense TaxID=1414720 RepID=A0ABS2FHS2_9CLOT|nr:histidine kinase [Clostridium saudiense]MBM6820110.1 histidine kinase [Clostridium saudiense]